MLASKGTKDVERFQSFYCKNKSIV